MEKLVFVSGNSGKISSVIMYAQLKKIPVYYCSLDFLEPNVNDISYISKKKAEAAYQELGLPCFVSDSGFYIDHYPKHPGYPGAFAKRSKVSSDVEKLLQDMRKVVDRNCKFVDCITYYDGCQFVQFFEEHHGVLATEVCGDDMRGAKSNLWKVFIPEGYTSTLASMTHLEKLQYKKENEKKSAILQFLDWYQENRLNEEKDNKEEIRNFFDWLEEFTVTYPRFSDNQWLYSPYDISPNSHIQLQYLPHIFDFLELYSSVYHIPPEDDVGGQYYAVKYHDKFYAIGQGNSFGSYYGVGVLDDVSSENVIDIDEVLIHNIQKKKN